jgi:phosphatidylserine/phosphatidylglycerophosphate/cardiolipin synthase-like enzyme
MGRIMKILALAAALFCAAACLEATAQEVHFAPEEDLSRIDVALIGQAKNTIDLASYALTDRAVLQALLDADHRGVAIRIVLDPREHQDFAKLDSLSENVRIKRGGPFMHLKAFVVDGALLRTGAANFTESGERNQDNDLVVIHDAGAVAKFEAHFERMWDAGMAMDDFEPAIKALEPK